MRATRAKRLGATQAKVFDALVEHESWSEDCGWIWGTPSSTRRIMDSLVRAGVVKVEESGVGVLARRTYRPILDAGDAS